MSAAEVPSPGLVVPRKYPPWRAPPLSWLARRSVVWQAENLRRRWASTAACPRGGVFQNQRTRARKASFDAGKLVAPRPVALVAPRLTHLALGLPAPPWGQRAPPGPAGTTSLSGLLTSSLNQFYNKVCCPVGL